VRLKRYRHLLESGRGLPHSKTFGIPERWGWRASVLLLVLIFWSVALTGAETLGTAKWITAPTPEAVDFEGANWIWPAEPGWSNTPAKPPFPNVDAGAVRWFQRTFAIPAGASVRRATLIVTADNLGDIWLNGRQVAVIGAWEQAQAAEVTAEIRPGENLLAARVENQGTTPNEAGLLLKLKVELEKGTVLTVVSDASWKAVSARPPDEGWKQTPFKTSHPTVVVAKWGERYWAKKPRIPSSGGLPLLRKNFALQQPASHAVIRVCGLGHFDLFLDGQKVGDHFLDPAWSVYEKTVYYSTFELSTELSAGAHTLGVMLGKGFYNTSGDRRVHGVNANRPLKLILEATFTSADGSRQTVLSDGSWKTAPGPITHSAILGGEDYDARRLPVGWDQPGFSDAAWQAVVETEGPGGTLRPALAPPMKFHEVFKPVGIDEPAPGIFVYDFGQNVSGVPRLRVRGQAGQSIRLVPAEQRHGMSPRRNDGKGRVNQAGVGKPNYFQYTLRGGAEESWTPQFSYTGFQYLEMEGGVPDGQPNPEGKPVVMALESAHVRSAARVIGAFECSNPLFNRIDRLVDWAVRGNLAHVLTDCPHREKLGWLEVAYLMGPSMAARYDLSRFLSKISRDCADSQRPDGLVPTVAPAYPAFQGGFAYTPEWGAAAVLVPWQAYEWYGDRATLAAAFPAMKGFVDYLEKTSPNLVPRPGLGDWYDYGHGKPVGASQFTPPELSAMATFYRCARTVADSARILGRDAEQRQYSELAARIAHAFNARYFDGAAEYKNHGSPQTANGMALALGLAPAGTEEAVLGRIIEDIRRRGNQQTAGDIGHWYLLRALAENGRSDVIFDLTARTNLGSYGFIVNSGWTSMPEAWDANTGASMNHCMLGHIQEWFFGWVAGIRPDPAGPGFQKFILDPHPVGDLTWARARHDSPHGRIASEWKRDGNNFDFKATVPSGAAALIRLPAENAASVSVIGEGKGLQFLRFEKGAAVYDARPGEHHLTSKIKL